MARVWRRRPSSTSIQACRRRDASLRIDLSRPAQAALLWRPSRSAYVTIHPSALPASIDETLALLKRGHYVADRSLATVLFLALKMGRPLLLEGEAGVGKTEIAKVLAATLGRNLIRLQCYEGLDVAAAVYE